jgi:hypothetical protein
LTFWNVDIDQRRFSSQNFVSAEDDLPCYSPWDDFALLEPIYETFDELLGRETIV